MRKNALGFVQTHNGARIQRRSPGAAADLASAPSALSLDEMRRILAEKDAVDAWKARGMPDDEIQYDEDAPRMTETELAEFEPASILIRKP